MIFKTLLKIAGYFTALTGAVVIVWNVAVYFNTRDNTDSQIEAKIETVIELQRNQGMVLNNVRDSVTTLSMSLGKLSDNQEQIVLTQKAIKNIVVNGFAKQMTPEEVVLMMQSFEKKNNEIDSWPIPLTSTK